MKKIFQLLFIFLATGLPVFGQGSQIARPIPRVSSFPATCIQYDLVQYTGASNPGLYVCGASNNWTYQGAGGTVTSVGLAMPSVFTVTNSPVTDAANLTAAWASGQTAGRVLGTPAGAPGAVDLVQIANGHVAASAAIDYSKLNLAGSILNADISNSAAIANAKLANSAVTIGSTSVSLGATAATIAGLTLTTPTIADFTNATHNHTNAAGGGQITTSALSGLGTGVATALAVNVGSAGAPVLFNGAGGTPSSLTLTNATGLPPATGISGWPANAAGVLTNDGSGNYSWGVGGTTMNSTNGQLPYRVNSTTFGDSAFASNALNSTYLSATSGASGAGLTLSVAGGGTNENLILTTKGSGVMEQRNGTNAQTFRIYGTYTDASNYRRLALYESGNYFYLTAEDLGSGAARGLVLNSLGSTGGSIAVGKQGGTPLIIGNNSANFWIVNSSGHFVAATDNTYDIGAAGATRPRDVNVGRRVIAGDYISASNTSGYNWSSSGWLSSPADGVFTWTDNAVTSFNRLQLGGTSASFGAIGRDGAGIKIVGADGTSVSWIKVPGVTVANLPAAATAGAGARSFVTDALTPVFGSAVTGGGAVKVPVFSDGTNWIVG